MKILIAEDDLDLGSVLKEYLHIKGYDVVHALNGNLAYTAFVEEQPDICVLDVMMPELDGFSLAEKIQKENADMPFVFLTAKNMKEDKLRGLGMGAADYITKPFDPEELIMRLENIMKRYQPAEENLVCLSQTVLNNDKLELNCCGEVLQLTVKEAELIAYLFANKNKIVSREDLLQEVWGEVDFFVGRSMDVFISRIRKYLSADTAVTLRTVRGRGFVLEV